ncbi:Anaerobic ribonucleoside-triphosphate reductase-activating protein [termite gut metagenome]|uniref:Anaerobic ribonucleoside-triphosphate reductase-activating protein n=1 Tax=termite gut metagenome TaxID=433724 RepID=A0A5J4SMJ0_9ZZZZ
MLHILHIYPETIVDGEGIRYSIYLSGCRHHCPECHNPESWNPQAGETLTQQRISDMIREINANPLLDGITFSGGDPLYNPSEFLSLVKEIKEKTHQNIWCYTGYTCKEILLYPELSAILPYIDVLVDGKFEKNRKSPHLHFRGSDNQQIIRISHTPGKEEAQNIPLTRLIPATNASTSSLVL